MEKDTEHESFSLVLGIGLGLRIAKEVLPQQEIRRHHAHGRLRPYDTRMGIFSHAGPTAAAYSHPSKVLA